MFFHFLLASMVSEVKAVIKWINASLFEMLSFFSYCFQHLLFILGFPKFCHDVSWWGLLWVQSAWYSLSILDLWVSVFHQIWRISALNFQKFFSIPFSLSSEIPFLCMLDCLIQPKMSLRLFIFCSNMFSLCSSN